MSENLTNAQIDQEQIAALEVGALNGDDYFGAVQFPMGIEAAVCADIAARQELGVLKYGCTVGNNPLALRDWLQHAYEEALDLAVYLKRAMSELDAADE